MTVSEWTSIVRQSLLRRFSAVRFAEALNSFDGEIDGTRLFDALVECRISFCAPGDPLVSHYIDHLNNAGLCSISQGVVILTRRWNCAAEMPAQDVLDAYSQTIQDLTMMVLSPKLKMSADEARKPLMIASRWLSTLVVATTVPSSDMTAINYSSMIETVAQFVASLCSTEVGLEALAPSRAENSITEPHPSQGLRGAIKQAFERCIPLFTMLSAQVVERIDTVLKHINILDENQSQTGSATPQVSEIQALQFQVSIAENQLAPSKAGTMLFLEYMLLRGSTIDDGAAVNWLCTRHHNDYQTAFGDLVLSSFTILNTQCMLPKRTICAQQCQVYVQNKLPALLSMISTSSFNALSTEQAIVDSWSQVVQMLTTQELLVVGAHFLNVCSLMHLLRHETALQLIGNEELTKKLSKGLFTRDALVDQVSKNHTRGPKAVEELVRGDGSTGFISQALVEIMHGYCRNKETQALKDLANALIRKPAAINYIALFVRPSFMLTPLCALLDDWRWDEIHGEAQPVYDEFGAILLLILITKERLQLSISELGIRKKDGFLSEYFKQEGCEQNLEDLSEERKLHLGEWINALYVAEGLSDDLFTKCSPHDFYLLIPTLLRQSITAYQRGKLTAESLKAGLDYLLEPFLLPSLIPALTWVVSVFKDEADAVGNVLEVLAKSPTTTESQDIHHTILELCAPQLKLVCMRDSTSDASIKALNSCQNFTFASERQIRPSEKGILEILQESIIVLLASTSGIDTTEDTSNLDVTAVMTRAVEARGANAALQVLLRILLRMSDSHQFLFALDAITTLISISGNDIRDALRLQYANISALLKTRNALGAEAVVRLYRQVEAYAGLLVVPDMDLDTFAFGQQLANIDTADPNLDAVTAVNEALELPSAEQDQTDSIDQVLDEAVGAAAFGNPDSTDADMSFDAIYGMDGGDMDLNDFDLDMF